MADYMQRTGVTAFIKKTKSLCRTVDVFYSTIVAWVNASTLTSEQKTSLLAFINAISAACALVKLIPDD